MEGASAYGQDNGNAGRNELGPDSVTPEELSAKLRHICNLDDFDSGLRQGLKAFKRSKARYEVSPLLTKDKICFKHLIL